MRKYLHLVTFPYGANILGLLELFAFMGILGSIAAISDRIAPIVGAVIFLGGTALVIVFDLYWRKYQSGITGGWRSLFSPSFGGCIVYVPIWLVISGPLMFLIGRAIFQDFF